MRFPYAADIGAIILRLAVAAIYVCKPADGRAVGEILDMRDALPHSDAQKSVTSRFRATVQPERPEVKAP
jgi:hypothetical protein